jgi:hypothetical protein
VNTEAYLLCRETRIRHGILNRFRCTAMEPRDVKKALDAVGRDTEISIMHGGPSTILLLE